IKAAGYPDVDSTVTVQNYGAEKLYLRHLDKDGNVLSEKTYTMAEIEKMADTKDALYQSICSHRGIRSFRATGVTLEKLLKDAGMDSYYKKGSEIRIRTNDASGDETLNDNDANSNYYPEGAFTYDYLSQKRYTFTDIYASRNKSLYDRLVADQKETSVVDGQTRHNYLGKKMRTDIARSSREEVKPLIALEYHENNLDVPEAPEANYGATKECRAFRFFYGLAMDPSDSKMIARDETTMRMSYYVYGIDLQDTDVHGIDRTALEKAVESASKIREADYTLESWKAFKAVYDDAKTYVYLDGINQNVAHHPVTDQATLNQKEQELKAAAVALVKAAPDTPAFKPAKKPAKTKITSLKAIGKRSVKITWKKVTRYGKGYRIRYSTKKSMKGSKVIKVKGVKTVRKVVKKLKRGRKYYFQICTYGTKGSSAWSGKRSVRVK
ncbi:MAG: fibronectin type III domain-containing protein, partial [Anaerovoracaceae bacterium]